MLNLLLEGKHNLMLRRILRWFFSLSCLLLLTGLVTACSLFGGSGSGSATPTTAPSVSLTTYSGDGFTIGYPAGWKVSKNQTTVTFTDPQGIASLAVSTVNNVDGALPSTSVVQAGMLLFKSRVKNYQTVNGATTVQVAGDTWSQGAATGDLVPPGQSASVNVKTVVIADNHPAHTTSTKAYTIVYATGSQVFDLANQGYFQPMLQSFNFA